MMPALAAGATYAIGKVFLQHFGSGWRSLALRPDSIVGGKRGVMLGPVFYIIMCLLTGLRGTYSRVGFGGTVLLAMLLTPIPVLLVLTLTEQARRRELQRLQQIEG